MSVLREIRKLIDQTKTIEGLEPYILHLTDKDVSDLSIDIVMEGYDAVIAFNKGYIFGVPYYSKGHDDTELTLYVTYAKGYVDIPLWGKMQNGVFKSLGAIIDGKHKIW